jgi:hypothetical protein
MRIFPVKTYAWKIRDLLFLRVSNLNSGRGPVLVELWPAILLLSFNHLQKHPS